MPKRKTGLIAVALALVLTMLIPSYAFGAPDTTGATSIPAYTRALKYGCRGADVKALQEQLTALGYYKSKADSVFGNITRNSVKSFQRAKGLSADGIVGRKTFEALWGAAPSADASTGSSGGATPTTATYALGKLNNRVTLRYGSSGSNVKDLQAVLKMKGFFTGEIDGRFKASTRTAVKNFQRSVGLETDGLAGNYTLSALYTMLNPPDLSAIAPWPANLDLGLSLAVEKPAWSAASSQLFKTGSTAVVVDVRTGYAFTVKRTGGHYHADVETVTPLDTATFCKSAGCFSWARRPVWVVVNGHRLAASMNCMPHGYDSIAGNDMKGQFCIHFVGSRTHGSGKVDPDHRKCIEEAFAAPVPTPAPSPSPDPTAAA